MNLQKVDELHRFRVEKLQLKGDFELRRFQLQKIMKKYSKESEKVVEKASDSRKIGILDPPEIFIDFCLKF